MTFFCSFLFSNIQFNILIPATKYNWHAKHKKRIRKGERLTHAFKVAEQNDRNEYIVMPSPRGRFWLSYVQHRLKMFEGALGAYANQRYARLGFDKYVQTNRTIDRIAASLTNKLKSIIYIGSAEFSPNSPIGIRKNVRCPGTRKLVKAFKKLGNVYIRFVDEYFTSQTCARCFGRFDRNTRAHRFKVKFIDSIRFQ